MYGHLRKSIKLIGLSKELTDKVLKKSLSHWTQVCRSKSLLADLKVNLKCSKCTHLRLYCTGVTKEQTENPNIEAVVNGDEKLAHKLKVIILEMEVMRQEGKCVPPNDYLKNAHWLELLKLHSLSARRKYLEFLFKTFKKKENELLKRKQAKEEMQERLKERPVVKSFEEFVQTYDLQHNNIFLRFYDTTIHQMYNNKLIQAIQFGQKLVVDCGYNDKMTTRENRNCAKQLMLLFADNRVHEDPYDVHFCNANTNSVLMQALHNYIPTMYESWFPMNVHEKSYLDLFPKEQLVYLTPHCREELVEYDHDAVYIVGAIVDKVNSEPLSLAKAKKERIRMAKLPLDRYLQWGSGSGKSLTLNQVISILLDVKRTGDWIYALRHVPKRKLVYCSSEHASEQIPNNVEPNRRSGVSSWSPSYNNKLENLSFNRNRTMLKQDNKKAFVKAREKRERMITARSIMFDE